MLPFAYALRNLWRRRTRTLLTIAGVVLITMLVVLMTGFARGLSETAARTASDDVVLLTAADEQHDLVRSAIGMNAARTLASSMPHVLEVGGRRAIAPELHMATRTGSQVGLLRGVEPEAFLIHRRVTVVVGREPAGPFEVITGRLAESRMGMPDGALDVGRTVELEGTRWTVVGRFAAPGTVLEAEVWGRLPDVMAATRRVDVSAIAARVDPAALEDLDAWVVRYGVPYQVALITERAFFRTLERTLQPIATLAWLMAALILVGGVFACTNTMFAAALSRTRETGTLRALGFGPWAVGFSLFQEALLLGLLGGLVGFFAVGLFGEVPLKFPMGAFYLDLSPSVRFAGLLAAVLSGILGGLVPAIRTVRLPLPDALGDKL